MIAKQRHILSGLAAAGLFALTALSASPGLAAEYRPIRLPKLNIDASQTTVSGISSGAYMAGQFQIAYSSLVKGAAIVAGGPYSCATATQAIGVPSAVLAMERCMNPRMGLPDIAVLKKTAQDIEKMNDIDPLSNLAGSRIYLFNGANDKTVFRPVTDRADELYRAFGTPDKNIEYVRHPKAAHAYITDGYGKACDFSPGENGTSFYLNDCKYDQAGAVLQHLVGGMKIPNAPAAAKPAVEFDQTPYIGEPSRTGMADKGFVYIPEACAAGQPCRLHVAFHGCKMAVDLIGNVFAEHSGYNRWADVNNVVVLYPQISYAAKKNSGNPKACWDWWGYTGYDFARKGGFQMKAVRQMIADLSK